MDQRLARLLDLLDTNDDDTTGTSIRVPTYLREAAAIAVELGLVASTTELTVHGLRDSLTTVARHAVLDEHYRQYPEAKPSLAEIAQASAELHGNPLATQPDLIRRAADAVAEIMDDADADDVLLYAAGLADGSSGAAA